MLFVKRLHQTSPILGLGLLDLAMLQAPKDNVPSQQNKREREQLAHIEGE